MFSNFVSGLWLLFEGSVRPGEVLMIDGDPCEVRRLGLRATLLWRDRDNAELLAAGGAWSPSGRQGAAAGGRPPGAL